MKYKIRTAISKDGKLLAISMNNQVNNGAYASHGHSIAMSAAMNVRFAKKGLSVCRASELPDPASSAGFALPAMRR